MYSVACFSFLLMPEINFLSALLAGIVMFFLPCTLPVIPVYISIITGSHLSADSNESEITSAGRKMLINGLFFVTGFGIVFVLLGVLSTTLARLIGPTFRDNFSTISGILLIVFGLMLLIIQVYPLLQQRYGLSIKPVEFLLASYKTSIGKNRKSGSSITSFLVGLSFAFGWSPCLGPIVGGMLTLAANSETAINGILLMAVFAVGLAIPFMLLAILMSLGVNVFTRLKWLMRFSESFSFLAAILLILLGILIVTGQYQALFSTIDSSLNNILNYDELLRFV